MTTTTRTCCACLQPINNHQPQQVVHPECADTPAGELVIFANVTFTEDYTVYGEATGTAEKYKAGDTVEPLQLEMSIKPADVLNPGAMWTSEAQSSVCGDWTYFPGRVLRVDPDSIHAYKL